MFLYLFLLFTVVPVFELYLLIQIGEVIGGAETIVLVIVTGFIGAWLAKGEGRSLFMQIQIQMAQQQLPAQKLVEGIVLFVGGVLLITPGVMTDIFGLSLVFPLTRKLWAKALVKGFQNKIQQGSIHVHTYQGPRTGPSVYRDVTPSQPDVIDVTSRQRD